MPEKSVIQLFVDSFFSIGYSHYSSGKPCQDYALVQASSNEAWAIVSDGCSSGGHTDVGARVLAHSLQRAFRSSENPQMITPAHFWPLDSLWGQEDLLATCLSAYLSKEGGMVRLYGDGVIAFKYADGSLELRRFDWDQNTPFYPAYLHHRQQLQAFRQIHTPSQEACVKETVYRISSEGVMSQTEIPHTLDDGVSGFQLPITEEHFKQGLSLVALFSDGVTQIDNVDWVEAVQTLMAYKQTAGQFVVRRMINGLKNFLTKGKGPLDDISCAVIRVDYSTTTSEGDTSS